MVHHRPDRHRLRQVGLPVQVAVRLLDVDDHRVDIGPIDEIEHRFEAPGRLEDRRRRVEGVDAERLHRHVAAHRGLDRQLRHPEAGTLVDQRAAFRHTRQLVASVVRGGRHRTIGLDIDEDVDPRQRCSGRIRHRADQRVVAKPDLEVARRGHGPAGAIEAVGRGRHRRAREGRDRRRAASGRDGGAIELHGRRGHWVAGDAVHDRDGERPRREWRRRTADGKGSVLPTGREKDDEDEEAGERAGPGQHGTCTLGRAMACGRPRPSVGQSSARATRRRSAMTGARSPG